MPKVFVTADTHFGHSNIIRYCRRPFVSIEEMDNELVSNWNAVVSPNDTVWHLGDFAFANHTDYLERLNGKIHLLLGNHDKFSQKVRSQFFEVRDLFHGRLLGDKESPHFFLFHYPLVSWAKKGYGCIHLYGHVHGRYSRKGERSLDVGVDVHKYTPLDLLEAIELAEINYGKFEKEEDRQQPQRDAASAYSQPASVGIQYEGSVTSNQNDAQASELA